MPGQDRFPGEDVRLRRALSKVGILLNEPSGLLSSFVGLSVKSQIPIFVNASGVGLHYGVGLQITGGNLATSSYYDAALRAAMLEM